MRQMWWKWLGIILLIYTIVAGLSIPLNPGIVDVQFDQLKAGQLSKATIYGYNTHFDTYPTRFWLTTDEGFSIEGEVDQVVHYGKVIVDFNLPSVFPGTDSIVNLTLTTFSEQDGNSVLPSAAFVKADALASNPGGWEKESVESIESKPGIQFPYRNILNETIRNTFYHIPLWFSMFIMLIAGLYYSIMYLRTSNLAYDVKSSSIIEVAILFGILGMITGSLWARFTWGTFWTADVKLNMATIAMLIYIAYSIFRSSIPDVDRRAKLSAAYSIFAFAALIPLVFIIPRMTDSLHPGNGGNPALGEEDMDNTLRLVFYPAIIGFTLLGLWIASLRVRYKTMRDQYLLSKG